MLYTGTKGNYTVIDGVSRGFHETKGARGTAENKGAPTMKDVAREAGVALHIIYPAPDGDFRVEKQIMEKFPERLGD